MALHTIGLDGPWKRAASPVRMPAFLPWESTPGEAIELRRSFSWPAGRVPGESVSLVVAGLFGSAEIYLGDDYLGRADDPWNPARFDVTELLRPRGELRLCLRPIRDPSRRQELFGSADVALRAGGWESVRLEVESDVMRFADVQVSTHEPTRPDALVATIDVVSSRPSEVGDWVVELNGREIHRQPIATEERTSHGRASLGPFDLDPWRPRALGLPIRHELTMFLEQQGRRLDQTLASVGFRDLQLERDGDDLRIRCGGESFRPTVAHRARDVTYPEVFTAPDPRPGRDVAVEDADLTIVQGHLALESDYDRFDRAGRLVIHEPLGAGEWERAIRRLHRRPSVIASDV